jgi:ATP-dependent Lhr-like helicase
VPDAPTPSAAHRYFDEQGWQPFAFQEETWGAYRAGESGLVHAATGTGKTLAAYLGAVSEWADAYPDAGPDDDPEALTVLWITPLRALAADTEQALQRPVEALGLPWRVERRTGDTSASVRKRQKERLPTVLVTTPESLSLFLTRPRFREQTADLKLVVCDEWHELLGSKRGTQTELALARLRRWHPSLRTWGLSATLGNLDEAADALCGVTEGEPNPRRLVRGEVGKTLVIDSLIPPDIERFPWAGHIGFSLVPEVIEALSEAASTLLFVNSRTQAERWFRALLEAKPEWAGEIALHHGSLARGTRRYVEKGLKEGKLRAVVCTSSLDLGVDFPPVDRVLQLGSPKGVARLLQRAGRSGHRPGVPSRVTVIPTHAFELVEAAAAREATEAGRIEPRHPVLEPLDLLAQHLITCALGEPFDPDELYQEVRTAYAYHHLSRPDFEWALDFAATGGPSLHAYDDFKRLVVHAGRYAVPTDAVARRHRLNIGTVVGGGQVQVQYVRGQKLGLIDEGFLARLDPGDTFFFAGKALELVRVRDMVAQVKRAKSNRARVPNFSGGRLPLSSELGEAVRRKLSEALPKAISVTSESGLEAEMEAVLPLLEVQADWSRLPDLDGLLVERTRTRDGVHLFFFPFEGRAAHEGMAALVAYRMARYGPITFSISLTDYGFELVSREDPPLERALTEDLFALDHLDRDLDAAINEAELEKRQFREIARIAGLIQSGMPGAERGARQLQASAGLLYDVFRRHDPDNLLLRQARREVRTRELQTDRIRQALARIAAGEITVVDTERPTPLAFPILAERLRARVSSETVADRIRKMQLTLERAAG